MAAISTVALVIGAAAAVGGVVISEEARKDAKAATARSEASAREAQAEQEAVALSEKKAADTKLEEQRARILKGQQGRGGLLFGSELGVTDEATTKTTLGA